MSGWRRFPVLYEIHTAVWLTELSVQAGRPLSLATVPDAELDAIAAAGFDGVWLMGVWQRSAAARALAVAFLPTYPPDDVTGSPYAIARYQVEAAFGGDDGLAALRARLHRRGLRLVLDFVPNHLACDTPWLAEHPQAFMFVDEAEHRRSPARSFSATVAGRPRLFAHGTDPQTSVWADTVQLDHRRPETRRLLTETLRQLAEQADGVRCDMAMLVMRAIFLRTWGGAFDPPDAELWPAAIAAVKRVQPDFLLLAEVYWDLEEELQRQGFDYTYDKRLYDHLVAEDWGALGARLTAPAAFQEHAAHFTENHDEPRAVSVFGPARARAAALVTFAAPGLRLVHHGQLEGRRLRVPVQVRRRRSEAPDPALVEFHAALLRALAEPAFHDGRWWPLRAAAAWEGNPSHRAFQGFAWQHGDARWIAVANLAATRGQCWLPLPLSGVAGRRWVLADRLGDARYDRDGDELASRGLYLDLPPFGHHLFALT